MSFIFNSSTKLSLAVTTGSSITEELIDEAQRLALELVARFVSRRGHSLESLFREVQIDRLLVIRKDRYSLYSSLGVEYQFHPNLAIVRGMNYAKTGSDHYLEAAALKPGDRVLDCTLGFGSEALLASSVVGMSGEVVGLESVPELAVLTRNGMGRYPLSQKYLEEAMRRVVVLNCDYRDYLPRCPTNSVDVVYFDPFFKETLEKSAVTVSALAHFGNRAPLDLRSILEARRVAQRSVILKHPKNIALPSELLYQVEEEVSGRKSPISYAVIPAFGV